jgi:hypothetical protein
VPFEVTLAGVSTSGRVFLWTDDPLTLALDEPSPNIETVWAIVVLGFADLTVWPELEQERATIDH